MPYKDKVKQREYFKEYKLKNKEKCNELSLSLYHTKKRDSVWLRKRNDARKDYRERLKQMGLTEYSGWSMEKHIKAVLHPYNITLEEYQKLFTEQNKVCKICGGNRNTTPFKYLPLAVDHCHKTGKNRGLLCRKCNLMIGMADDNQDILQKGINYLKQYEY